ncbi:MAG: hypothetical protein AB1757_29015 [Acidobacteriota bacterium]
MQNASVGSSLAVVSGNKNKWSIRFSFFKSGLILIGVELRIVRLMLMIAPQWSENQFSQTNGFAKSFSNNKEK